MSDIFTNRESAGLALSTQLLSEIEQASLRAWPALEEHKLGDWCLRFSKGFTKRANSVSITNANSKAASNAELLDKIKRCEQHYHYRNQPTIFRIVQTLANANNSTSASQAVDRMLATRNYRYADVSLVMTKEMTKELKVAEHPSIPASFVDLPTWLAAYQNITASSAQAEQLHTLILEGIQADLLLALTHQNIQTVACGLGVLDGQLLGLFDIATHPDFRQRGFARSLVQELCASGTSAGAKTAYLQVQEDNFSAITLYAALGFTPAYRYGYRIEGDFPG